MLHFLTFCTAVILVIFAQIGFCYCFAQRMYRTTYRNKYLF